MLLQKMLITADKSFCHSIVIMFIAHLQSHSTWNWNSQCMNQTKQRTTDFQEETNTQHTDNFWLSHPGSTEGSMMGYIFCKIWTTFLPFFSPRTYFNFYPKITMLFFFCLLLFIYPENHEISDGKITTLKGADMFVCLLLQAERGLSTSQVNSQDISYIAGLPHWKLKKTWSLAHIPAWKKPNKKDKALDLPWESSFSSCHSGSLPRRRRCHLDCWGLREGWFWMVTQSHHGSVSVCLAVWNSAAPSFAGKTWVWKATGNEGEGMNEHSTSCIFTPLLTLS